ncbi:MAG: hypothetical protein ABR581_04850 [Thermoleophilaceae bacterium]
MTADKAWKKQVRKRMAETGESYSFRPRASPCLRRMLAVCR